MLRSPQFFERFVEKSECFDFTPDFCDVKYSKDESGRIHRTVIHPEVPPISGTPSDYSLNNLLSAGVMLSPMPSFESPSLDDLSQLSDSLTSEIIPLQSQSSNN